MQNAPNFVGCGVLGCIRIAPIVATHVGFDLIDTISSPYRISSPAYLTPPTSQCLSSPTTSNWLPKFSRLSPLPAYSHQESQSPANPSHNPHQKDAEVTINLNPLPHPYLLLRTYQLDKSGRPHLHHSAWLPLTPSVGNELVCRLRRLSYWIRMRKITPMRCTSTPLQHRAWKEDMCMSRLRNELNSAPAMDPCGGSSFVRRLR